MNKINDVKVFVKSMRGNIAEGTVQIQFWDKSMRTKRALKFLAICWALAVVSIVIPLAHFVLVPAFLIAGPIGASRFWNQTSIVLSGSSTCPDCKSALPIVRSSDQWPLSEMCSKCQTNLNVEKSS